MASSLSSTDVLQGVVGGTLIAASSSLNLLMYGRITGLSGMLNTVREGLLVGSTWKEAFLVGLVLPAVVARHWCGTSWQGYTFFDADSTGGLGAVGWAASGLLVGAGTKLGNGCTSGHGVCGIPRFSMRSIVATCTFCATGFVSRYLATHGGEEVLRIGELPSLPAEVSRLGPLALLGVFALRVLYRAFAAGKAKETLFSLYDGAIFGAGLLFSGMLRPSKVKGFLTLTRAGFDPQLVFVLGTVVVLNVVLFSAIQSRARPVESKSWEIPPKGAVDNKLVVGAALFGVGWGISGLCPGPGIVSFFTSTNMWSSLIVWMAALLAGQYAASQAAVKAKVQ